MRVSRKILENIYCRHQHKKTAGEAGRFVLLPRRECGRGRLHCVCGCKGATASRM